MPADIGRCPNEEHTKSHPRTSISFVVLTLVSLAAICLSYQKVLHHRQEQEVGAMQPSCLSTSGGFFLTTLEMPARNAIL